MEEERGRVEEEGGRVPAAGGGQGRGGGKEGGRSKVASSALEQWPLGAALQGTCTRHPATLPQPG